MSSSTELNVFYCLKTSVLCIVCLTFVLDPKRTDSVRGEENALHRVALSMSRYVASGKPVKGVYVTVKSVYVTVNSVHVTVNSTSN